MATIHEVATVTSKGQITLPKPIRQALGLAVGGKVAFDMRGDEVVVTRASDTEHKDPAIAAFLMLIEADIKSGKHITSLPDDLAAAMLSSLKRDGAVGEDIDGSVAL